MNMRKLVLGMHTSLDGFVAGPNGEMDWIYVDDDIFNIAGKLTNNADTALYGRITWQMMEAYWPTAADKPNATSHDIEHSTWYNAVEKIVASRAMRSGYANTSFINNDLAQAVKQLKVRDGKNIQVFGSPSLCHVLMQHNLIDDYWLFVNPVILGEGIPLFKDVRNKIQLHLAEAKTFNKGVQCLHYQAQ
jgi:dihydrofolate reductase